MHDRPEPVPSTSIRVCVLVGMGVGLVAWWWRREHVLRDIAAGAGGALFAAAIASFVLGLSSGQHVEPVAVPVSIAGAIVLLLLVRPSTRTGRGASRRPCSCRDRRSSRWRGAWTSPRRAGEGRTDRRDRCQPPARRGGGRVPGGGDYAVVNARVRALGLPREAVVMVIVAGEERSRRGARRGSGRATTSTSSSATRSRKRSRG